MPDLPSSITPLTLADGRVVLPSGVVLPAPTTGAPSTPVVEPVIASASANEAEAPLPQPQVIARAVERPMPNLASIPNRRLGDLPDVPRVMNAINVVVCYTLFGMPDDDICLATGLVSAQLEKLRANDAYAVMRNAIVRGVLDSEAQSVRDLFLQHARSATGVLVDSLANGSRADRLSAARDLLDRAGHRPADVVEHRHRVEGGLVIEVVRKDERDTAPTIDMEIA